MLREIKSFTLHVAETLGLPSLLMRTKWRANRLLILCYHGVSLDDEHLWNPDLYMTLEVLRGRFQMLKDLRTNIISLDQGVQGLHAGTLPERSVVITFDDGSYDFYCQVQPLLREFAFPATVYLTTYYSDFNRPVFDVMCSYLLWKGQRRLLEHPEALQSPILLDEKGRGTALREIRRFAFHQGLSGREKDVLLASIATTLKIDYEDLCERRILHLMTPAEVAAVARDGIDIQLHTHRHRVSINRQKFLKEIHQNRAGIAASSSNPARHFCYPGGFHLPEFPGWLRDCGVISATTCRPGLAYKRTNPLLLPRLVDHSDLSPLEFSAWISGLGSLLPHRRHRPAEGQLMEEAA
jgi:peptidoglycan/xylan/chitin deacetylase (PgdA/CDA1 family)